MALTDFSGTLKGRLDAALPETLADILRILGFGDVMRSLKTFLWRKVPVIPAATNTDASAYEPVTANGTVIPLPDDAKALSILRAYARAGGVAEELIVDAPTTALPPAAGHVNVTPAGNIVLASMDAITDMDVSYEPMKVDIVERFLAAVPATGVAAIPSTLTAAPGGVYVLMEAEIISGAAGGKKVILAPAAGAPAASNARLDLAKMNVQFAIADAPTQVRVKLGIVPAIDVNALLEGPSATV